MRLCNWPATLRKLWYKMKDEMDKVIVEAVYDIQKSMGDMRQEITKSIGQIFSKLSEQSVSLDNLADDVRELKEVTVPDIHTALDRKADSKECLAHSAELKKVDTTVDNKIKAVRRSEWFDKYVLAKPAVLITLWFLPAIIIAETGLKLTTILAFLLKLFV